MSLALTLVPTSPDEAFYTQRTKLDGTVYRLTFRYNQRENTYRVDVALDDATPVVSGQKIICNIPLFYRYAWDPNAPKGALFAISTVPDTSPPGLGDLGEGRRVQLWYVTGADVLRLQATAAIVAFLKSNGGSYMSPSLGLYAPLPSVIGVIQQTLTLTTTAMSAAVDELTASGTIRIVSARDGTPIQMILLIGI